MTETAFDRNLTHLAPVAPAATRLGHIFARPKPIAVVCVITLTGLGWLSLGLMAGSGQPFLDALCRPVAGITGAGDFALIWPMWCAMTLAMMLPTAGAMIWTYAEIADTAAAKGERIVSPFVLAGGYAAVWLGFAVVAAALQATLARTAFFGAALAPASALWSGAIFIAAGLYQFSALKHACLRLCQQPFQFFFLNWSTQPRGVFRLGLKQGIYCLGCCWAMMLVMFAVGVMNVVWMAALAIVMTIEKMTAGARFAQILGLAFLAIGAAFIVSVWIV